MKSKKKGNGQLGGNLTTDLFRLCMLDKLPEDLHPPQRGLDFPPGLSRILGRILDLLGWNVAAEYFVATPNTRPFRFEDPLVEVPRATQPNQPGTLTIRFQAPANEAVNFKDIEVAALNPTAERFGDVSFAEGGRNNGPAIKTDRLEQRIGVAQEPGRYVKMQGEIRANGGIMDIVLRNFDQFSVARFGVEIEGWVVQR